MTRDNVLQVFRWLILGPVTALVAFGTTLLVLTAFSDSGRPRLFGLEMFVVTSGSMRPSIEPGDVVMVNTGTNHHRVGDVITFRPLDESTLYVTHRVVEVSGRNGVTTEYLTKGDANPDRDFEPVVANQVVGSVSAVFPFVGRVVLGLRDPRFVLMVGMAVALAETANALQRRERRITSNQIQ
jgi:signal peptidase